jgi:hypothetical protein
MWRHHKQTGRAGIPSHSRVLGRFRHTLRTNPRDNGHLATHLVRNDPRHLRALFRAEREDLARMTVRYQPSDSRMACQPTREAPQFRLIDRVILAIGDLHRRQDSSECIY